MSRRFMIPPAQVRTVLPVHRGALRDSADECAQRVKDVLREPELGRQLARAGKEHVRKNFLTPRLLRDWLRIFKDLR